MYTGKMIGRLLLVFIVIIGTILLFQGVMEIVIMYYESAYHAYRGTL